MRTCYHSCEFQPRIDSIHQVFIFRCVRDTRDSILSHIAYIFFLISFLHFIISRLHTHVVRFRRACRSVLMWSLQYARRPKCGSSYVRHTLVAGGCTGDGRIVSHTEKRRGSVTTRAYRRQWHRRDARQEGGRIKCLTHATQCHVHIPIHGRSAEQARLLVHRARTHIVTSVAKRLTASANFTRTPRIGS